MLLVVVAVALRANVAERPMLRAPIPDNAVRPTPDVRDGTAVREFLETGTVTLRDFIFRVEFVVARDCKDGTVLRVVTVLDVVVSGLCRDTVPRSRGALVVRADDVVRDVTGALGVSDAVFLRADTDAVFPEFRRTAARAASVAVSAKPAWCTSSAKIAVKINLNPFILLYVDVSKFIKL
jgi:hypothetical protein